LFYILWFINYEKFYNIFANEGALIPFAEVKGLYGLICKDIEG
jgi:hypothetical protein